MVAGQGAGLAGCAGVRESGIRVSVRDDAEMLEETGGGLPDDSEHCCRREKCFQMSTGPRRHGVKLEARRGVINRSGKGRPWWKSG